MRTGTISRKTNETSIDVELNLDGTGVYEISTGIGFLDHMLEQLSRHSLIDLTVKAVGDLHIDQHHTTEDTGIAIGEALAQALGEKRGIIRYGSAYAPMPAKLPSANGVVNPAENAPTLVINPPRAAAGFDSQRIIYTRESHQLNYFAHNEWIDTPARMLAPLIVAAVSNAGIFRAVVPTPSLAAGDIRLDTEIVRLQQVFGSGPSRVQFTLRVYLVDSATRRVLAWREFDETVTATSEDARGGVEAANRAVQNVLLALTALCVEAAGKWQSLAAERPVRKP